jgi:hypothetical protein
MVHICNPATGEAEAGGPECGTLKLKLAFKLALKILAVSSDPSKIDVS